MSQPHKAIQHPRAKALVWLLLCAVPLSGAALLGFRAGSWIPLATYGLVSVVTFLLYGRDKRSAQGNGWRTPEKVLHALELAGGWPGALIAQQVFRHKTRKVAYQLVFWLIVLLHQVFWIDQLFLGATLSSMV